MRHVLLVGIVTVLSVSIPAPLRAADQTTLAAGSARDEATQNKIDGKVKKLLGAAKVDDPAKAEKAKAILGDYLVALWDWHKQNDPTLSKLWSEWGKARTGSDKDEFPGEVIAHKIEDVYASLKPACETMVTQLGAELTPEQIDAIKEQWSRTPGMTRTYNAYLEAVPGLTDDQKKIIRGHMERAREAAMLTDNSKEIVNIYKVHKVKVEQYIGALEWAKLHSAFANKGKAAPDTAKTPAADDAAN